MSWLADPVEANELQWDGRRGGHHEGYHLGIVDPEQGRAWWFRYTLRAPSDGEPRCALWGATYAVKEPGQRFALRTEFPTQQLAKQSNGFHLRVSKGELSLTTAKGGLRSPTSEDQRLRWHLTLQDREPALQTLPRRSMYRAGSPLTKLVTPVPSARVTGVVEVGGQRYSIDDGLAHQDHTWGTGFPGTWSRAFASHFREDRSAWVDAYHARDEQGRHQVLVAHVRTGDGQRLRLGGARLGKGGKSDTRPGVWNFIARRRRWSLEARFSASLQSMTGVRVPDLEGGERVLHASGIGDATFELYRQGFGKRHLEATWTARNTALFEQGAMEAFDGVQLFG